MRRQLNGNAGSWISRRAATVCSEALRSTTPAQLAKLSARSATNDRVAFPARNVVAVCQRDPALRREYVSLTAHNDHVGFDHAPVDHDSVRAFARVVRPMGADSPPREPTQAEWTRFA
jgi:hypothetical protein